MKRTALLGVLLAAALACTAALSTSKLAAFPCCENPYGYSTSQYWVMESTCSAAQTAFRVAAINEAYANCGGWDPCSVSIPGCYQSGGMWVVDGFMYHGCMAECGPPSP
jgi:hypothetical protein